jgi:dTDP-glucose pyrophosphorylase
MNILIPMAGEGRRFKEGNYETPKPLIQIFGKPMAINAIESLGLKGQLIIVVQDNEIGYAIRDTILAEYPNTITCYAKCLTEGPACSALLAKEYIDNDIPLVITNCDQILTWDAHAFDVFLKNIDYDGLIVTYTTEKPINSYARLDKLGLVSEIKEKEVISDISLNGIHCWAKGSYFVSSSESMVYNKEKSINGEYYIGPSYNSLIKDGKKIGIYHIPSCQHHAVGIPEDLNRYIEYANKTIS